MSQPDPSLLVLFFFRLFPGGQLGRLFRCQPVIRPDMKEQAAQVDELHPPVRSPEEKLPLGIVGKLRPEAPEAHIGRRTDDEGSSDIVGLPEELDI